MSNKLRVAIAGLDHWYVGLGELEAARRSERFEVVALAHRDAARAEATAKRFGIPDWTTDYAQVVTRPDVDTVVTAAYPSENPTLCLAAAHAGKHIVSVKPIALRVADADAIARVVRETGVHFVSYESLWRLMPIYRRIKQWVGEGRIGPVLSAYTMLRSPIPMQPWPGEHGTTFWLDPRHVPGGGWIDHAIYHIDFLRWVLNDEVAQVAGEVANIKHRNLALEDYGVANVAFRGGARATLEVTWTGPASGGIAQVHLLGEDGHIVYDPTVTGKLAVSGKFDIGGWQLTSPLGGHVSVVEHLAEAIQNGGKPIATVDDARANLAVALAFYQAAREGRGIGLE